MKKMVATKAEALAAVCESPRALEFIPQRLLSPEVCLAAFPSDAEGGECLLRFIPEDMRTEEVCQAALALNGRELAYVPEALLDEELCRFAVRENWSDNDDDTVPLQFVPKRFRTEAVCADACRTDGRSLAFVPDEVKTEAMCLAAVQDWGYALKFVPESMKTEEICSAAVETDGGALQWVPEALKEKLSEQAMGNDPLLGGWNAEEDSPRP